MPGPPRPSFPSAPSEPSIRRLGVRSSASIERPIRAQAILALVAAVVLLAVPLYLLRRPPEAEAPAQEEVGPQGFAPSVPAVSQEAKDDGRISLADAERVRCGSSEAVHGQSGRLCDQLPFFEGALSAAITETVDCAPRTGDEGSLNYVLKIDFNQKTLHVFPGASGTWTGPQARRATKCVKQALPAPDWEKLEHKFRYYELAILATYRPPPPEAGPLFE